MPSGRWAIVEISVMVRLSRDGEDEDGDLCLTCRLGKVVLDFPLRVAVVNNQKFARIGFSVYRQE
jgi:hypothetical protein